MCKPPLPSESPEPTSPPVNQASQGAPASPNWDSPPSRDLPAPEWASQLAAGIPKLAHSLDKLLSRLDSTRGRVSKHRALSPSPDLGDDCECSEGELSSDSDQEGEESSILSSESVESLITSVHFTFKNQRPLPTLPNPYLNVTARHHHCFPLTHS